MKIAGLVIVIGISIPSSSIAQDSTLSIYPTFISALYTGRTIALEEYNPLLIGTTPIIYKSFYGEVRYNYDQINTFGIYGGKKWNKLDRHILIPQIGILYGDYKGLSFQFYYQYFGKKVVVNFQNQYAASFRKQSSFYFNWSDFSLPISKKVRLGGSMQLYFDKDIKTSDFAIFASYKTPKMAYAFYSFDFYNLKNHFFALGIQREIKLKAKLK